MKNIRNLKVYTAVLCLGVSLLISGCDENNDRNIVLPNGVITFLDDHKEDDIFKRLYSGSVARQDLHNFKILTFQVDEVSFKHLVYINNRRVIVSAGISYNIISYYDFNTDFTIIEYKDQGNRVYITGEDIQIISEEDIDTSHIFEQEGLKESYDINTILDIYSIKEENKEISKQNSLTFKKIHSS